MIPENIKRNHLLKAIEDVNANGITKGRHSSTYDLIYEGERYPPKLIISLANKYANGNDLDSNLFYGGNNTPAFKLLEKEGFEIIPKNEMFFIEVSNDTLDDKGQILKAKLIICKNGYKLLKGSYLFKEPKPSFLNHSYFKMRVDYESKGFFENTTYSEFLKLKNDIHFDTPSPAAVTVLNRAANGKTEWKLKNGTTLEEYENKLGFSGTLKKFLKQANTNNLKTKHFQNSYKNIKVKVSFGQGYSAKIPWISFLKDPFKTSDGVYPVYLYYKNIQKLILAYGRSVTNKPKIEWDLVDKKTIFNYFDENNYDKPEKYGDSHVFKVYDVDSLPDDEVLNQDLSQIIEKYSQLGNNEPQQKTTNKSLKFDFGIFEESCKNSGLNYSSKLITRYVASLITKPFVLLSGLSGSGKTKLAQSFAEWLCKSKKQYCIIPVGADWTNREPLLGYVNALNNEEYILPENGALELIINANKDENNPYFLVLDEMNLSHVERYFADFLSIMESNEIIKLHSSETVLNDNSIDGFENAIEVPKEIGWPKNLFIVGTVNIDETTYMFSPKVLDRANVIEFRINETQITDYLNNPKEVKSLTAQGSEMGESFVTIAENKTKASSGELTETLRNFFVELQKVGAEFGYRTASEIQILLAQLVIVNKDYETKENEKIDIAIMQKLLPKLHGSRRKLITVLETLGNICLLDNAVKKTYFETKEVINYQTDTNIKYPLSLEKIVRMHKSLLDNGFASYAEA